MSGVALEVDVKGLERIQQRLDLFANVASRRKLLDAAGAEVESQTHRRLLDEKESPDGEAWDDWSPGYAATRHGGHSLLMGEGDMNDSVQFLVSNDQVEIGSNLAYAAIQHFGGAEVGRPGHPDRFWLGLSNANIIDLVDVLDDWADQQLRLM